NAVAVEYRMTLLGPMLGPQDSVVLPFGTLAPADRYGYVRLPAGFVASRAVDLVFSVTVPARVIPRLSTPEPFSVPPASEIGVVNARVELVRARCLATFALAGAASVQEDMTQGFVAFAGSGGGSGPADQGPIATRAPYHLDGPASAGLKREAARVAS